MTRFQTPLEKDVFVTPPESLSEGHLVAWHPHHQKRQHPHSEAVSRAPEGHLGLGGYSAGA